MGRGGLAIVDALSFGGFLSLRSRPEGFGLDFGSGVRDWIIAFGRGVRWGMWIVREVGLVYLEGCAMRVATYREITKCRVLEVIATVAVDEVWAINTKPLDHCIESARN